MIDRNEKKIEIYKKGIGYQYIIYSIRVSILLLFFLIKDYDDPYFFNYFKYLVGFAILAVIIATPIQWIILKKKCERILDEQKSEEEKNIK